MTLNFSAKIQFSSDNENKSIYDSLNTDNEFYPENPTKTKISLDKEILIELESHHLPHLRANLNSILRLLQASYNTIISVKT
ncbi:MAG: KEOPS complex subunit Pcc1 [Crenarchaeota archaeon]|nr:KEOPS complex subunit Pcc1 [Thermoproteota archaeon]MDA1125039.1 KEOPS complex subunit Pcc1 [Thermoproteota archaeon]